MPWYRRLRWLLVGVQLLVVVIGVAVMVLVTVQVTRDAGPRLIEPELNALLADPSTLAATQASLLEAFRSGVLRAVALAATVAIIGGISASLLLWRLLVLPLQRIATSAERIANGRFDERVATPHVGEAMVQLVQSFNQMAATLQEVEAQRVAMIGNVAHELRTPLSSLRGFVEGIEDGVFPASPETYALMATEIARLSRLVEDIQVLSRVEAGAVRLEMAPFDLNAAVVHCVTRLRPEAQRKVLNVSVAPAAALPPVLGDADRVAQILTNVIGNAIRYTPDGGAVSVTVDLANQHTARVVVSDTGIGLAADELPFIFERFYRVDRSRSRQSGGSGVGLTISRHLAWAMGGDLQAASDGPGQGSRFTITLPLAPRALT